MSRFTWKTFTTIIRIPIILFILYFVFNVFAFVLTYFRFLGTYNTVTQVVVNNGYIPATEFAILEDYMAGYDTDFVDNIEIVTRDNSGNIKQLISPNGTTRFMGTDDYLNNRTTILQRSQYGQRVSVGIKFRYTFVLPLMTHETYNNQDVTVAGYKNAPQGTLASEQTLEQRRQQHRVGITIVLENPIPSLKYYPDLQ